MRRWPREPGLSHLVLAEAVRVLDAVYDRTAKQLIAALDLLLAHESLVLQDADVVAAALAEFRAKPACSASAPGSLKPMLPGHPTRCAQ